MATLNNTKLPTFAECEAQVKRGLATALEQFIYDNEPAGLDTDIFREGLQSVLEALTTQPEEKPARMLDISMTRPEIDLEALERDLGKTHKGVPIRRDTGWVEYHTGFATEPNNDPIEPQIGLPECWQLVQADVLARADFGFQKYGVAMTPHCGRDPLIDIYQELLDATFYLRQELFEKYGK